MGKVYLVGAGPGDPGLITVKASRCLAAADVVLYDSMVARDVLESYCERAERIDVGKRKGGGRRPQSETIALLVERARAGKIVVRVKGGDPLVFGRGGEEARALKRAGIPFEIVPGVSSVAAVPAYAGIPVTDREYGSSFGVYSAHRKGGLELSDVEWRRIAWGPDTLVFLMGKTRCDAIVRKLVEFGRPAATPAALVYDGTTPRQRRIVGTLGTIAELAASMEISGPGLIVAGDVVRAIAEMDWFEPSGDGPEPFAAGERQEGR